MRNALMKALNQVASENSNLMLLTADLGYGVFEEFEQKYPKQYLNVGVAEQNMIGIATGLALEGKTVFVYSIGNFPTLRCLEQIRNDACYHNLNINIIAMGGGFSYGALGMSHHATEDIAIMKSLPNVTVVAPCTANEAEAATLALAHRSGVGYLRIDKSKADLESEANTFEIGKAKTLVDGNDYTIFVTGGIAEEAVKASLSLKDKGIGLKVVSLASIKPVDVEFVVSEVKKSKGILTLEEGNIVNGLSSTIADICIQESIAPKKFHALAIDDVYVATVGSQSYLRSVNKITGNDVVSVIENWMN